MAEQKWVAMVGGKEIGVFTTQKEAEQAEHDATVYKELEAMLDSCSSYDGVDMSLFIEYFISNDKAQLVVDYLQSLIEFGEIK